MCFVYADYDFKMYASGTTEFITQSVAIRYSKLAGESLTMGNANVADLSDPNRPTKLAEQFSELYDNEWTDAFEELEHMTDSERISYLLYILQVGFCTIVCIFYSLTIPFNQNYRVLSRKNALPRKILTQHLYNTAVIK